MATRSKDVDPLDALFDLQDELSVLTIKGVPLMGASLSEASATVRRAVTEMRRLRKKIELIHGITQVPDEPTKIQLEKIVEKVHRSTQPPQPRQQHRDASKVG